MLTKTLRFGLSLLVGLILIFGIHQTVLYFYELPWNENLIVEAYFTNYLLVLITYFIIIFFKERKSQSLGFIFLGGFFLKLAVFMIFFNPFYKSDNEVIPAEFFAFFTSYAFCLIYETTVIVKILNKE